MAKRKSEYSLYYDEIKGLLISGMTIAKVYKYIEQKYKVGMSYNAFWGYLHRSKLQEYVTEDVKKRNNGGRRIDKKNPKPAGCTYPNCFQCLMWDCVYNGNLLKKVSDEELYDMSKQLLEGR